MITRREATRTLLQLSALAAIPILPSEFRLEHTLNHVIIEFEVCDLLILLEDTGMGQIGELVICKIDIR